MEGRFGNLPVAEIQQLLSQGFVVKVNKTRRGMVLFS
jgi:hypothetical protein